VAVVTAAAVRKDSTGGGESGKESAAVACIVLRALLKPIYDMRTFLFHPPIFWMVSAHQTIIKWFKDPWRDPEHWRSLRGVNPIASLEVAWAAASILRSGFVPLACQSVGLL